MIFMASLSASSSSGASDARSSSSSVGISQVDVPLENTVLGQDRGLAILTEEGRDTLLAKVKDQGIQLLLSV